MSIQINFADFLARSDCELFSLSNVAWVQNLYGSCIVVTTDHLQMAIDYSCDSARGGESLGNPSGYSINKPIELMQIWLLASNIIFQKIDGHLVTAEGAGYLFYSPDSQRELDLDSFHLIDLSKYFKTSLYEFAAK
jgi:hypothetical protein